MGRSVGVELVTLERGPGLAAVEVLVTIDGRRTRVDVPHLVAGERTDYGEVSDHAVRAEVFDRGTDGVALVVTTASGNRYANVPDRIEHTTWTSRDGTRWTKADVDLADATPRGTAQAGSVYGF